MSEINTVQNTVLRTPGGLFIAGTRITLYDVMDYLAGDWPPHLIRHGLNLTEQQMADVMQYIDTHRAELETVRCVIQERPIPHTIAARLRSNSRQARPSSEAR